MANQNITKIFAKTLVALFILPNTALPAYADAIKRVEYTCNEGIPLIVEFINTNTSSIATISVDSSPKIVLENVQSGSGAKYENDKWSLHVKGKIALLNWGEGDDSCSELASNETNDEQANAITYPRKAKSWGGIVRAGPGQNYLKRASLREGERVLLLEKTKNIWNGYPWFKIKYRGRTGYKWGGILCSVGEQVEGTYQTCN